MLIRPLDPADGPDCDQVVASLPYFFGDQEGLRRCARAVRSQRGWVAERSTEVVGFLTVDEPFPRSPEVTWMAVHADCRRRGIGHDLVATLIENLPDDVRNLVVTTLSEATTEDDGGDTYAGTRRFYQQNGFEPIWEPEGWWSTRNQAVVMVRRLPGPGD